MPTCAAYRCVNRSTKKIPGITFHRFPKNSETRQQWIKAMKRENWLPTPSSRLCSSHFKESDLDRTSLCCVRIREGVIPSIFPDFPEHRKRKSKVHFDKSQFERNQDGTKVLKWSAIPRMYEEWTEQPSANDNEYDNIIDNEGMEDETSLGYEMESVALVDDFATPGFEGALQAERRKTDTPKRERTDSGDSSEKGRSELCIAKKRRKGEYPYRGSDDLDDELSRIKATIKRIMGYTDTEQTASSRHNSPMSTTSHRSDLEESVISPGNVESPDLPNKHCSLKKKSPSLQPRQLKHTNQSNKTSGRKICENSSLLKERSNKKICNDNVSVSAVAKKHTGPRKRMKRMEEIGKARSKTVPTSQLPKKPIKPSVTPEKDHPINTPSSLLSSMCDDLLKEIMSDTIVQPKRDTSEKPWRTPEDLLKVMNNKAVCFAPGRDGMLTKSFEVEKPNGIKTKQTPLRTSQVCSGAGRLETKSSIKDAAEGTSTLPRVIKVQSLNLSKNTVETKFVPLKIGEVNSNNSSVDKQKLDGRTLLKGVAVQDVIVPKVITVKSVNLLSNSPRTDDSQKSSSSKELQVRETPTVGKVDDRTTVNATKPRIALEQGNTLDKGTEATKKRESCSVEIETYEIESIDVLKRTVETHEEKNEITSKGTPEKQNSCEFFESCKRSNNSKGNDIFNLSKKKSPQLKKNSSILCVQEDKVSNATDLQKLKNNGTRRETKTKVGVQAQCSQSEEIRKLKAEIEQLQQQLQKKERIIQQLQKTVLAVLPPQKGVMVQSESDKFIVFADPK